MTEQGLPLLPTLETVDLTKVFGSVVALDHLDFAVYPGEILGVIGDNGAGKSTLVRCLSGAETPDAGITTLDGAIVQFRTQREARFAGINAVYQTLKVDVALDIAANLHRDREPSLPGPMGKVLQWFETKGMRKSAAATPSKVIILDEPTAALGQRESMTVRRLIENLRTRGLPIVLVSHDVPLVFATADRIHVQRLGKRAAVVTPRTFTVTDLVAIMSGALTVDADDQTLVPLRSGGTSS